MQTFLPDEDFYVSAKIMDKKRLFKQVIEARQILASNGVQVLKNDGTVYKATHKNHPCIKMWYGYDDALKWYHNAFLEECIKRGIKTTMGYLTLSSDFDLPPWLGDKDLHDSHKSNLLRKDPVFYGKYNWNIPDNLEYVWKV